MIQQTTEAMPRLKERIRAEAMARREAQPDGERLSRDIFAHIDALPVYRQSRTVMLYIGIRGEVHTRWFVPTVWKRQKRLVTPYCAGGEIVLFRLESFEELASAAMGLWEPKPEWRRRADRAVDPAELDLILAPGLAFDRQGGRLGYGKGYYDRLLPRTRPDATKLGTCFECQLFAEVPRLPHDIVMDGVVTEKAVYWPSTTPADRTLR
jgi:5-formyltetrahydrofolate cyclo-ligase